MKRKLHDQKGVAAVEFALILLPLVLLIFGAIEFTTALYDKAVITNASREGARVGIVFNNGTPVSDGEITNAVNTYCSDHLISFGGPSTVSTEIVRGGDTTGSPLTVRVNYTYNFLVLPNFIATLGSGITMQAETVMRKE